MKRAATTINIPIALWSLAISILLWVKVFPQNAGPQIRAFELTLRKDQLDDTWVAEKVPDTIRVTAKVSDREYQLMAGKAPHAEVDFSHPVKGQHQYPVSIYPRELANLVREVHPTATCVLQKIKIKQHFPVIANTSGTLSDPNLVISGTTLSAPYVLVRGPEDKVNKVVRVQATLALGDVDVHQTPQKDVDLEALDSNNNVVDVEVIPNTESLTFKLSQSAPTKSVFVDIKFKGKLAPGLTVKTYQPDAQYVMVTGDGQILDTMSKIPTRPIDLGLITGSQTIMTQLVPPDGVVATPSQVRVTIEVVSSNPGGLNIPGIGGVTGRSGGLGPGTGVPLGGSGNLP